MAYSSVIPAWNFLTIMLFCHAIEKKGVKPAHFSGSASNATFNNTRSSLFIVMDRQHLPVIIFQNKFAFISFGGCFCFAALDGAHLVYV